MAKFEKKGYDINLNYLVIHKATKEAGSDLVGLKKADKLLKINDSEKFFISDVRKSFYGRSLPTYGIFEEDNKSNGFLRSFDRLHKRWRLLEFFYQSYGFL